MLIYKFQYIKIFLKNYKKIFISKSGIKIHEFSWMLIEFEYLIFVFL